MKRLYNMRWTLARRALQLAVLGLFAGTAPVSYTHLTLPTKLEV